MTARRERSGRRRAGRMPRQPGHGPLGPAARAMMATLVVAALTASLTAQVEPLKADAPLPLSPAPGTRFEELPAAVTLTVVNARGLYVPARFDHRFEIVDATNGRQVLASSVVPSGATTTGFDIGGLGYARVYEWRVRAERDGGVGPWSQPWRFETPPPPYQPPGPLRFTDVTTASGLSDPPRGGHGAAFADATGSGLPDLYITTNFDGPTADRFFVNQGDGTFTEAGAARGVADVDTGSHGGVFGDLDNDGDYDLVNGGTGLTDAGLTNDVYRNDGGTFTDVKPDAMRARSGGTRGVVTFDMDRDGDLDIFAVNGWTGSGDPSGERNELYRNDGALRFTAITSGDAYTAPAGQGVTDTDFDGDGDIDLITGNRDGDLVMLRNNGSGTFSRVDPDTIGIRHRAYSGVTAGDIDTDGDLDLLLVGLDNLDTVGHLYRNLGAGRFAFIRSFGGIVGFMGAFADLDHDGDLDLVFAGDDVVYLNDGGGTFAAGPPVPVDGIREPRAIGFADIDDDGDVDFAIGAKNSRNWLVRNDVNGGRWLKVRLRSARGQAGAFGAKISVYTAATVGRPPIATRETRSNNGYLGQDDPVVHLGLGDAERVDVAVTFLDGTTRILAGVLSNQTVTIDGSTGGPAAVFVERHRPSR